MAFTVRRAFTWPRKNSESRRTSARKSRHFFTTESRSHGEEVKEHLKLTHRKVKNSSVSPCLRGEFRLPLLVSSRAGYQNLCRLITKMKLRAKKGEGAVQKEELEEHAMA
jgi:DNA polymerase III alpha subunit